MGYQQACMKITSDKWEGRSQENYPGPMSVRSTTEKIISDKEFANHLAVKEH